MNDCKCGSKTCIKCKDAELKKAKKKIDKYEKAMKILLDDSVIQETFVGSDRSSNMYESVIFEKNIDGEMLKKHNSDLGESYIILEKGKNIDHLSNKERRAIEEQDNLKNYENTKKYVNKGTYLYGAIRIATKIGGFFIGLF